MPIHDQGYRRYGGTARTARPGVVGHRAHAACSTAAASAGRSRAAARWPVAAVPRARACRSTLSSSFPQVSILRRRRRRRFATFSISRGSSCSSSRSYSARADRRRSPGQRAAALPVEAADPGRVHHRQAGAAAGLSARRDLASGHPAAAAADRVLRAAPRSCRSNLFLVPAITLVSLIAGAALRVHDAGAVVALEEPPVRRCHVRRASSSSRRPCIRCCAAITGSVHGRPSRPATCWT